MTKPETELRKEYLQSQTGDLTRFAAMLGEGFSSRVNLLAQLIHDKHAPSVGAYKERLLADLIRQYVPERYSVGTGFVLFPNEKSFNGPAPAHFDHLNGVGHTPSLQCDILVYDAWNHPVVFRDKDFVVLRPEAVRAVVEIKGTLTSAHAKDGIHSLIDFGKKWQACSSFYKSHQKSPLEKLPGLFLLGWQIGVGKDGKPLFNGKRLRDAISREYKAETADLPHLDGFPMTTSAYIYNDCIASSVIVPSPDSVSLGYFTDRGQLVRFDQDGTPELIGDKTIAALLGSIQGVLETPHNRFFANPDQSTTSHEHPDRGYSEWLDDAEVKNRFL